MSLKLTWKVINHWRRLPYFILANLFWNRVFARLCHGWFHSHGLTRAVRIASRAWIIKCKILAHSGIRTRDLPLTKRARYHWVTKTDVSRADKRWYRGMIEIHKSGDKTSLGEIGLDIRTHASPKRGQDQVFHGNLAQWDKKANSVIRSISVMVKNWCNILSMEGVTVCGHHPECRVTFERGDLILFERSPYRP